MSPMVAFLTAIFTIIVLLVMLWPSIQHGSRYRFGKRNTLFDPLDNSPLVDPAEIMLLTPIGTKVFLQVNQDNAVKFLAKGPIAFHSFMDRMTHRRDDWRYYYKCWSGSENKWDHINLNDLFTLIYGSTELYQNPHCLVKRWQEWEEMKFFPGRKNVSAEDHQDGCTLSPAVRGELDALAGFERDKLAIKQDDSHYGPDSFGGEDFPAPTETDTNGGGSDFQPEENS